MIKKTIDFKLINIALIAFICYLIYKANDLWFFIFKKIISILLPIVIGFIIAYFLYPLLNLFKKFRINKIIGIIIIILLILLTLIILIMKLAPLLSSQLVNVISELIYFTKELSFKIDLNIIFDRLMNVFNQLIDKTLEISIFAYKASLSFITNFIICISSFIYFLIDMDKIRFNIKDYLINKNTKLYKYVFLIHKSLQNYIKGMLMIVLISFFEYTFLYFIIGHPSFLILGILSSIANIIPSLGGIFVCVIGVITGFIVSPKLALTVTVATLLASIIDNYLINPIVYKKSNQIHPLVVIISVFSGGILFGFWGVLIALPLSIIVVMSYKFYKDKLWNNYL